MKIFILLLGLLYGIQGFCISWATVTSKKAIIFSDIYMTSKIGFIRGGKKIRISDTPRNEGRVFPFVYKNKVVYIAREDIQTSKELLELSSAVERVKKDKIFSNLVGVGFNSEFQSIESKESYLNTNTEKLNFIGFGLSGHVLKMSKSYSYRGVLNYQKASSLKEDYKLLNFDFFYHKQVHANMRSKFDFYSGLLLSPLFTYKYADDFSKNGLGYGIGAGLYYLYHFSNNRSIDFDLGVRYRKLSVKLPSSVNPNKYEATLLGASVSMNYLFRYE
ncbi:MAG: hypothetical protein N4A33_01190 [Bacteriovoracaceae bacterium]|jgi:hypothetical protein|nr:hypothetical protein [Bacteriovoracaceae bacterium]